MTPFNACEYLLDRQVARDRGRHAAIRQGGWSITYSELLDRVERASGGLRSLGVRPEERVILVLLDGAEFAVSFLAAMRIGAVPLPLNPLLPGRDLGLTAADARGRLAVVSSERLETAMPGLSEFAPELTDVIVTGEAQDEDRRLRCHRWADVMMGEGDGQPFPTWEDSPGFWLCTSGTTGRPKLAMHRHVDLRTTAEGYAREVLNASPEDRFYSVAPMFHAYGLGNSLSFPLSVGATAILEPRRPPTPALVANVLETEQPTLFFSVPTSYGALLAADLPSTTFRTVRQAVSAGEALPGDFLRRFQERFGVEILDGIGSTELTHIFISNRCGTARAGSSGLPVDGYDVRLEDDTGVALPLGSTGNLVVSGQTAATGYWCRAEASRQTFRGEWVHTGDMYETSTDGYYHYLGRADDMLKVGGEWVAPSEVEAVILEDESIVECAVVGMPSPDGLTLPVAFVVAADGRDVDIDAIAVRCRSGLAGFKRPRRIIRTDSLPKTATGKIQRAELRTRKLDA